ncbi:HK97 family phage prohead protease [Corynebacterium aquilae]|uniref:HK97 family phage prohead protease n=1 Tax=Corynebacterium aquilae TaxID=203263 RepID=UPI000951F84E|nr:HK97 family phage prohead protease [Corynebacterium aquilae]
MIHLVIGPPCSGKSSFVEQNAPPGVPRFDFDHIAATLAGVERGERDFNPDVTGLALAMRRAMTGYLLDPATPVADAWVVNTAPPPGILKAFAAIGAKLHVLDPGEDECVRRAMAEGRSAETIDNIRGWYKNPPEVEEITKGGTPMRTKNAHAKVKAVADGDTELGDGEFVAYASVFGNRDSYGDVMVAGAFANTLAEWEQRKETSGDVLPVLYGHDFGDPFSNIGTVLHAEEDEHGLKVRARLDLDNPKAAQVYRLMKDGRLTQMSFAFDVVKGAHAGDEPGDPFLISEVKLYEVSVVPIGANQATEILDVKQDRRLRLELPTKDAYTKADVLNLLRQMEAAGVEVHVTDNTVQHEPDSGEPVDETTANALKARFALLERNQE